MYRWSRCFSTTRSERDAADQSDDFQAGLSLLNGAAFTDAALDRRTKPAFEGEGDACDIERAEDVLVVLGEPLRKINVEVVASIIGEPRGDRRQRTAHLIERKHENFAGDDRNQTGGHDMLAVPGRDRNSDDATGKYRPRDGVHDFDDDQLCGEEITRRSRLHAWLRLDGG